MKRGCAERAGIKKRFWPYLTRHSVLTPPAKVLPYSIFCVGAAWKHGSRMPAVYIKLAGEDIDEAHQVLNGIKADGEMEEKTKPKTCVRCNTLNSVDSKF